jgi:hypothetical protein
MCFRNDQLVVNRKRLGFVFKDILYFFIYICACAIVVFGSDLLLEQLNCKLSAKSWEAFWVSANYFDSELCSMLRKIPIQMMNMSIYYRGELNWAVVVLLLNSIYANRRIFYDPRRVRSTDLENEIYPICNSINATVYACKIQGEEGVYLNYNHIRPFLTDTVLRRRWGRAFRTSDYDFNLVETVRAAEKYIQQEGLIPNRILFMDVEYKAKKAFT